MPEKENTNEKLLLQVQEDWADEVEQHPSCQHGPTVLFYRQSQRPEQGYYACSAHRDSKLCNFHMAADKWERSRLKDVLVEINYPEASGHVLNPSDSDPTKSILALAQDKVNAQYFFDEAALDFLADQCRCLGITKVVCMGAPRLHFRLRANYKSFLLDLDERFARYLGPEEFCLYNMCNNHFFYKRKPFEKFLQCSAGDRLLIVTDPPFGCRTELIAHTLRALRWRHNRINQLPVTPLSIFWIFPYFSINHIRQEMPEMEMSDYRINYSNHSRYTNVGKESRYCGSPVRLFTNVPLQLLNLPQNEGYKYCPKCSHHTASDNLHCGRCQKCTSKNGQTYRHCNECDMCVKPSYVHCHSCRRCTQREGHDCSFYQTKQQCWLCGQRGHIETNCGVWKTQRKRSRTGCLLCGRQDHRERRCQHRGRYFKEHQFLGHTSIQCLSN
ncbi:rRNA N6-adenosine-methyltransferase ZCCHC4 [Drosophila miranda]|uniref:rRNA N6-adenosine-methyltransferase ZCCHC4 n=1 Tax=Drosophila miranda TaxID=7229 RepID=UPI0007E62A1D|nr:rRNA N6-adenosine-methyltransferase ZCCHC4 [Drosophila miranda]XP_033247243.1 rRNA N6-adenosine-methyltransferase ZCCHC4 [Drosophila miranda]